MRLSLALSALAAADAVLAASLPLRITSFNIRYAASSLETNEKPWWDILCWIWSDRCREPHVISAISDIASSAPSGAVTIFGLQEVLNNQLTDILNGLGGTWTHLGVGRDDGATSGEYSPILYESDQLAVIYSETKWLSTTPDVVSYGWGAGSRRVVTLAVFEHASSGKRFIHANTHLDNVSSQARSEGIKVVVARIKAAQDAYGPDLGVSLTGDFNSVPGGDAWQTLADTGYMTGELFDLATSAQHAGTNQLTYTGFDDTGDSRIDFIWLGTAATDPYTVQQYEIRTNKDGSVYISDHRPVIGDVTLV